MDYSKGIQLGHLAIFLMGCVCGGAIANCYFQDDAQTAIAKPDDKCRGCNDVGWAGPANMRFRCPECYVAPPDVELWESVDGERVKVYLVPVERAAETEPTAPAISFTESDAVDHGWHRSCPEFNGCQECDDMLVEMAGKVGRIVMSPAAVEDEPSEHPPVEYRPDDESTTGGLVAVPVSYSKSTWNDETQEWTLDFKVEYGDTP